MSRQFAKVVKAFAERGRMTVREAQEVVGLPNQTARQYVQSLLDVGLVSVGDRKAKPRHYTWMGRRK